MPRRIREVAALDTTTVAKKDEQDDATIQTSSTAPTAKVANRDPTRPARVMVVRYCAYILVV
jgi:hypothetical protein